MLYSYSIIGMLITAFAMYCCVGDSEWEQMHKETPVVSVLAFTIIFVAWPFFMLLVIQQTNKDDL